MCRLLGVNRTSFHDWERRPPSDRALSDAWLTEKIKQIHHASRGVYGSPRIHAELRLEQGIWVGRKRVARLMKAAAISGIRPRKRWQTTIRVPGVEPATDLVQRDFRPDAPNLLWVADITYLRTGEGWLHLAAVQDTYSRQIVGWSMATHMRATLVVDALQMALARRRPGPGLIHHSDQGSQYVSLAFGWAAREAGIAISMGSRGDGTTTRSPRRSSPRSKRSSSTVAPGRAGLSSNPPCSSTSRRSTTASAATPRSTCSPQPTTNNSHSRRSVLEINYSNNNNRKPTPCRANRGRSNGPTAALNE
jgi:putative transposase